MRALAAYRAAQETLRHQGGRPDDLAQQQVLLAAAASGVPPGEVAGVVEEWFETAPLALLRQAMRPGLVPLLERAAASDIRLAVLSDYPPAAKLAALGIEGFFDTALCAQDEAVRCLKPEPHGITAIVERWGLTAADCVYVGDRPEVDGEAAARAGVRCVIVGSRATPGGPYEAAADMNELASTLLQGESS